MNAPSPLGAIALGRIQRVHQAIVEQAGLDLLHVQADEIRVKARSMVAWMGLAMMVSTRLWLAGVVSQTRDTQLANRLLEQVRACCQAGCDLLICTDGWATYPGSIRRAFRDKVKRTAGRGRACCKSGRACTLGRSSSTRSTSASGRWSAT